MTRIIVLYALLVSVALTGCDGSQSQGDAGVKVSGNPGQGGWPLKHVSEGRIICRGWPPTQPTTLPTNTPWFIFFQAPSGELFALNGKAQTAVDNGRVQGRNLRAELMAEQRYENVEAGRFLVMNEWVSAGVALCKGNRAEAERLAAEAAK